MSRIKTVAIFGAGAIGAYFIWGLSEKLGDDLWVIAKGERYLRLKKNGIRINNRDYNVNVKTPAEAKGVDLLLVSVKYTSLNDILDDIEDIVGENTIVLSLLNGVDSEELIGDKVGHDHMLYSLMRISSERTKEGMYFNGETTPGLYYGEKDKSEPSERMLDIKELFDDTNIHYHMCDDIITELWDKFALNISNNLPQAILGCGIGAYEDSIYASNMFMMLRQEVVEVAAAKGITISKEPDGSLKKGIVVKRSRYSTLQDLDAKRHTEIDMFSGVLIKLGKESGVPTPCNEFVYNTIKAMEEKNDGKFDYE